GEMTAYAFRGRSWASYYPLLEPDSCVGIEPMGAAALLRPAACGDYNATVTPPETSNMLFWTPRAGVTTFRVMWNGQPVGDCPLMAGVCELTLPVGN
ncbi:MAG: hypothetical protein KC425_10215, partial [Anaerolineales bacterium]|nr:hypothetical protein [Anaerolineales bacterium]